MSSKQVHSFENILSVLEKRLSRKRLDHSLGVRDSAAELASRYGVNVEQAALAGLIHDYARELPAPRLLHLADSYGIVIGDIEKELPDLLHGPVGSILIREELGIDEPSICRAVEIHTTGDAVMSKLDKIVFIADYVEAGRTFTGVDEIRKLALEDLDSAVIAACESTLRHVLRRGNLIHPRTVDARNSILLDRRRKESLNINDQTCL